MPKNYAINRGDTLSRIAQQNGTTVAELLKLNPAISDPNRIYAGASLLLPDAPGATSVAPAAPAAPLVAQPSAGTATTGANYGNVAKTAGEAGVGLGDLKDLFGPTPEEQKAARNEIAKQFGYDSEDAFMADAFKKPSQTTEQFYQSAYEAAGLPKILSSVTSKKDALNRAIGVVNDNPWYDEAFRRGEAARLQDLAGRDIQNLLDEYNLKHGHVKELVGRNATDLGTDEKIRTARLNYLEAAAKERISGKGASRALEYIPQYIEGKKATEKAKEKPVTVSVPGTNNVYEYDSATGTWKLIQKAQVKPVGKGGSGGGGSRSGSSSEQKAIDAFNKALANRAALNRAGSREQFMRELQAQFPQIDPQSVADYVYGTYPDGYDS